MPVPEGPMMVMTSPRWMVVFTSVRGVTPGNAFFRCSMRMSSPSSNVLGGAAGTVGLSAPVTPLGSRLGRRRGSMLSSILPMASAAAEEMAK